MARKTVDTSKAPTPMIRNPATGRYVRLDSRIGRGIYKPTLPKTPHPDIHKTDDLEAVAREIESLRHRIKAKPVENPNLS